MTIRRINPEIKFQYIFFLISGIITLFMSTKYFPWRYLPQVFSYIQFPWRILMMSSFFLSVVCSINMYIVIKNFNYKDVIVISAISIIYIIAFASILIKQIDNIDNIKDINLGFISGKEHEVIAGMGKEEYLPSNAYNNRFYIATRDNNIYVLEGKAIIEEETKNGTNYNAQIKTLDSEYTAFELPYIYYPGYVVRLDGMIVDTFETANGFLGFVMYSNDQAELEVSYEGTNVMKISSLISFISFIAFSIYVWKKR